MAFNPFSTIRNIYEATIGKAADVVTAAVQKAQSRAGDVLGNLQANISQREQQAVRDLNKGTFPVSSSGIPPQNFSSAKPVSIPPVTTTGAPSFSPAQGVGAVSTDAQGNTFRFDGQQWVQIATGATPASFRPSGGTPPVSIPPQQPTVAPKLPAVPSLPQQPTRFNLPVGPGAGGTLVSGTGELLTGFGGFGGMSAGQFGGGTGISGIPGGASLLPGSLGGTFRSSGNFLFPTTEEDKKKKEQLLSIAENRPLIGAPDMRLNPLLAQTFLGQVDASGRPVATVEQGGIQGPIIGQQGIIPFGGPVPLSQSQQTIINRMTVPAQPIFPTPTGTLPSVKDLVSQTQTNIPFNVGTRSETLKTVADRATQVIGGLNQVSVQNTENTLKNATLQSMANNSPQTFGQQLTPEQVWQAMNGQGGDPATQAAIRDEYSRIYAQNKSALVDPATGELYKEEWFNPNDPRYKELYTENDPKQLELAKLEKDKVELQTTNPFVSQVKSEYDASIYKEEGVAATRALIDAKQALLDAKIGVYEGLADEIRNDPDFSKRLKANRLQFLTDEQIRQTKVEQRDIERLNEDLRFKIETANLKIKSAMDQYNIYANERNFIQNQINTINAQIEKASDNARAALNSIASNPDFVKGATQEELDREYASIQKLGYIPLTMIQRLSNNTGKDIKSIVSAQTTANTKTFYGIDTSGNVVTSFTVSDVSQAAGGDIKTSQITVDTGGTQFRVTYDQNGNEINRVPIGPSTKQETIQTIRSDFVSWTSQNSDIYTEKQLTNVAAMFMPTLDVSKDTAISQLIKNAAHRKRFGRDVPTLDIDPVAAFGGNLVNPTTGESYPAKNFTASELQEALNTGWILQ